MNNEYQTKAKVFWDAANLVHQGWCKDDYAKDDNNDAVSPISNDACRFCVLGALRRATYEAMQVEELSFDWEDCAIDIFRDLGMKGKVGSRAVSYWNDGATQDVVVAQLLKMTDKYNAEVAS